VTKIISVFQNITERKRAERERDRLLDFERDARIEIERSVHVRDDFLAIASHELRTPITPLKIYLAMMKNILIKLEPDLIKNQKTLVQTCINSQTQLDSLEKLIEDLLSVTRISAGRLQLARTDVNLSLLVAHVLNRYAEVSSKAGCKINYVCDENVIGYWDPLRIEQIVINIFSNALKYGAGNPIEVSVTKVNRKAKFVVLDHGIGMTREELSKIFQKFERGGSVKSFGGLGLGLFITKGYVTAHQGSIYAESKLHEGSIFTVELPLELERV
jgi:signal transduction histidine kinase